MTKLAMAIAIARQQVSPEYLGTKWPDGGIYRARNGQFMTGPRTSSHYRLAKARWTWEEFLAEFDRPK